MVLNDNDAKLMSFIHDMGLEEEDLFDMSATNQDPYHDELCDNLTAEQIEFAAKVRRLSRGVMLVTGAPGSGKDLFANYIAWKIKTYFKGRKVLRDDKPFPLFGLYLPINENILSTHLSTMEAGNKTKEKKEKEDDSIKQLTDAWLQTKDAEWYLQGSVLLITELKKYAYNRHMTPYGRAIGQIATRWRHFDLLIIGITPYENEIDIKGFLQYVTISAQCQWNTDDTTTCKILQRRYAGSKGVLSVTKKYKPIKIDGKLPVDELGGKRWYDLYNTKSKPHTLYSDTAINNYLNGGGEAWDF